jgi:hypothetical protein
VRLVLTHGRSLALTPANRVPATHLPQARLARPAAGGGASLLTLRHSTPATARHSRLATQEALGLHGLPSEVQPEVLESDTFLKALHHVLLEVHVEEGALVCPESGHRFTVRCGRPAGQPRRQQHFC